MTISFSQSQILLNELPRPLQPKADPPLAAAGEGKGEGAARL
jgi:hypothetical protein